MRFEDRPPAQIVVVAKEPVPGRAKTRLCPPYTPLQASELAHAALADTLDTVTVTPTSRRILLLEGHFDAPGGWDVIAQRGDCLAARLAYGLQDAAPGGATLLIGMDTPQVTPALLVQVGAQLSEVDAVLGPAVDGGWWVLALRDPSDGRLLAGVPMSQPETGFLTLRALRQAGLRVALAPQLRDVDTFADVAKVAAACAPGARFPRVARDLDVS